MDAFTPLHPRQSPNFVTALAEAKANGMPLVGLWSGIDSSVAYQYAAQAGFDAIIVDGEHTAFNPSKIVENVQIINYHSKGQTIPFVRFPHLESELLSYALGAGAGGIMLPHCESVEEVKKLVSACLFPPLGTRSFPPLAYFYPEQMAAPEGSLIFDTMNKHVAPIVQIESIKGVENAEAMLSIEGVKGCMIGIGDLFLDCGYADRVYKGPMLDKANPRYWDAVHRVADLCDKYNIPLLIPAFPLDVEETRELGPALIYAGVDGLLFANALRTAATEAKAGREAFKAKKTNGGPHVNGQSNGVVNGDSDDVVAH